MSRSSRWTMPGRLNPPVVLSVGPKWNCKRAGQRARPMPPGRMHDHARRLVDHHDVFVLVEHVQGDVFGPRGLAGNLRQHDRHPLARLQPIGRLAAPAVYFDAARRNHATKMDSAVVGKMARQKGVEPMTGLRGRRPLVQPARKKATSFFQKSASRTANVTWPALRKAFSLPPASSRRTACFRRPASSQRTAWFPPPASFRPALFGRSAFRSACDPCWFRPAR